MNIERKNRFTAGVSVAVCIALVVLIAALSGNPSADPARRRPSTFFTDKNGARAMYLILEQVFIFADQWRLPLTELAPVSANEKETLIVLGPATPLSEPEANALDKWIKAGGQLILATDSNWRIRKSGENYLPQDYLSRHGFDLKKDLTGAAAVSAAVTKQAGKGRVIYVPSAYAFSNETLRTTDNSVWLAERCMEWSDLVMFDEYHHGFGRKRGLISLTGMFLASPWGLVSLQLALAGAVYILGCKRRFGRPIEPLPPERTSPIETVQALGGLFESARARRLAARILHQHLSFTLSSSLGRSVDLTDEGVRERMAARTQIGKAALDSYATSVGKAMGESRTSDRELIDIARTATTIGRSFSHGVVRSKRTIVAGEPQN